MTEPAQQSAGGSTSPPAKLFIFPHAGGSANYYVPFAKTFSSGVRCIAVQYPKRRGGSDLSRVTSIPDLADDIYRVLKPAELAGGRFALFGHSMGAMVAFEVALRFQSAAIPMAGLFVSACAAPGQMGLEYLQGSDRELLNVVADLTGADRAFLANEDFAATLLPTLRSVKAIAGYSCAPGSVVSCPISAFAGVDDQIAPYDKMSPWSGFTTSNFAIRVFPGGHFYLDDNLAALVGAVETGMSVPDVAS